MRELKKGLKVLLLTLAAYLIQVCVMQYFTVSGVVGSVPFAWLAILVVSYGKKYGFCASCLIGILMECMLANVKGLYVIAYPAVTMLCAQFFADMTDSQRQKRRMKNQKNEGRQKLTLFKRSGKQRREFHYVREDDLPVIIRIPCCAALMDFILSVALCAYLYLIGVEISFQHVLRVLFSALYTGALALILMGPVRVLLGMRPRRRKAPQREVRPD